MQSPNNNAARREMKEPGFPSLLGHLAIMSFGIYRLFSWESTNSFSRAIAILLAVGGAVMAALWLFIKFSHMLGRQAGHADLSDPDQMGRDADAFEAKLFSGPAEYRRATQQDMRGLDQAFYQRVSRELIDRGFRQLGDVVNVTAEQASSMMRAVIRGFLSEDGTIIVGIYHAKLEGPAKLLSWFGLMPRKMLIIDVEAEMTDGTFVAVSNSEGINKTLDTPGINRAMLPPSATLDELLGLFHRLTEQATRQSSIQRRAFSTEADVLEAVGRMDILRSKHRASGDHDIEKQMEAVAGRPLKEEELEWAESQKRARARRVARQENSPTPEQ